jgi:hypothetical protein
MALNKEFFAPKTEIKHGDVVLCDVRGLTADDIARIVTESAADVETMLTLFEQNDTLKGISQDDPESVALALQSNGKNLFTALITKVPELVARVIAIAADDPEDWKHVQKNFPLPAQLNALTEAARLTFVDGNGFKAFVGNVMALLGNANVGQRALIGRDESLSDSPGSQD